MDRQKEREGRKEWKEERSKEGRIRMGDKMMDEVKWMIDRSKEGIKEQKEGLGRMNLGLISGRKEE